jgi:uroporphyrinogen-III decarboxylase
VLKRLAAHPDVESVILMDNVDTPFYAPSLAAEYWSPYVKDAADLMRARGKYVFVHACGKLAGLAPQFAQTRVSGLEGVAHPPLGDWTAAQAQTCHPGFIFLGGFSAHEQEETRSDASVRAFYREYLASAHKERFIFASSCQTAIHTKWERIKLVRDICREWGGAP